MRITSSAILAALLAFIGGAEAFTTGASMVPRIRGGLSTLNMAHHVNNKGAKKSAKNRPRKARLSDINRKAPTYDVEPMIAARASIPEFTVIGQADMGSLFKVEKDCGKVFYHTKAPHTAS